MELARLTLLLCSIFLVSASSCHRKTAKDNSGPNAVTMTGSPSDVTNPPPGPTGTAAGEQEKQNDTNMKNPDSQGDNARAGETYGLVVSFFSPGNGINRQAKTDYDTFLEDYKGKVEVEQVRWGREGEIDYCLKLSSLSAAEKKDFIAKSRQVLEKSDRVNITENAACVHKK